MKFGMVIRGEYAGRKGYFTKMNRYGNVMFYPIEGKNPYRVCLKYNNVKEEKEKGKDPA